MVSVFSLDSYGRRSGLRRLEISTVTILFLSTANNAVTLNSTMRIHEAIDKQRQVGEQATHYLKNYR